MAAFVSRFSMKMRRTIQQAWNMVWPSAPHSCLAPSNRTVLAARPFAYVDHLRVLDKDADTEDPLELYRTLLAEQVLLSRQYQFINLSLGPDLPIEDTDVHARTSVIDDLLSDGDTLMTVAIGNNQVKWTMPLAMLACRCLRTVLTRWQWAQPTTPKRVGHARRTVRSVQVAAPASSSRT